MRYQGKWICSKDCEECEGKGMIEDGMEGFVNRNFEQDCRSIYSPCPNAVFDEPDWDSMREEREDREREEREEA